MLPMNEVFAIPAFADNYLWVVARDHAAVVVDPGDAEAVQAALQARGLHLDAILVTHHHQDHTGGLEALTRRYPVPVYGPRAEKARIPGLTRLVAEGDRVTTAVGDFEVIELPGHTLGHIAYLGPGLVFCGDTLFSAGCGRLFEGSPAQMQASLARLAALPEETRVYCTHEYTLSNLAFASAVEPGNAPLAEYRARAIKLRDQGLPTLPSQIGLERRINPFLRSSVPEVRAAAERQAGQVLADPLAVFATLRRWKDGFAG